MKNLIKWKTIENHEARHWYDTDMCHTYAHMQNKAST